MTWSLASYTAHGSEGFGVLREDGTLVLPPDLGRWPSTLDLLEDWPAAQAVLRGLDVASAPAVEYDTLLPPLRWPRKVICAGVDMVCGVAELIAAASQIVTLEPGDVIATGTPSGVGASRGLYLRGGDVVRVTIDGLGTLENTVKENS